MNRNRVINILFWLFVFFLFYVKIAFLPSPRQRTPRSPHCGDIAYVDHMDIVDDGIFHYNPKTWINCQQVYSQYGQDTFLIELFREFEPGVYVDLSAAWPFKRSNTVRLEKCLGWRGVCIDADVFKIKQLCAARSCQVINRCVTAGKKMMYFHSDATTGMNTFTTRDHKHRSGIITEMQCNTLDNILFDDASTRLPTRIDFLSLDVEGNEPGVMLGIQKYQFDVLLMEVNKFQNQENDRIVREFLKSNGYIPMATFPKRHSIIASMSIDDVFDTQQMKETRLSHVADVLFVRRDSRYRVKLAEMVTERV